MGVFNFMETFFFISLGITFVLILLLVYHFKQRLATVEQKSDTMFDIMNNMVKEMGVIKMIASRNMGPPPSTMAFPHYGSNIPVTETFSQMSNATNQVELSAIQENGHDENEETDEDSDESDDDEETDDDSDGSDNECDTDEDNTKIIVSDNEEGEEGETNDNEEVPEKASKPVIDAEDLGNTTVQDEIVQNEMIELDDTLSIMSDMSLAIKEDTDVVVSVVNVEVETVVDALVEAVVEPLPLPLEDYRKLSLGELKQVVITKGLTADSSKMKKKELLELLGVSK